MIDTSVLLRKIRKAPHTLYRRCVDRPLNQLHCFDYPAENNGWMKYGYRPVWGNCKTGTMFDPYVYYENRLFKMVVSARRTNTIILLESNDGVFWKNEKILLNGQENSWDVVVNRACLVECRGQKYLWYSGQKDSVSCVGLALGDVNNMFSRIQDAPVLKADKLGEGTSVMNPCVLWDEHRNLFRMWYSAGETYEPDVICYAESKDGIIWEKYGEPILKSFPAHVWEKYKIGGCHVIKESETAYKMYYIGYQNLDVARICVAHSIDGINWQRNENNLILSPSKNAWDSDAVYKPSVVRVHGKEYLWYNGRRNHEEYIGLATRSF